MNDSKLIVRTPGGDVFCGASVSKAPALPRSALTKAELEETLILPKLRVSVAR